MGTGRWTVRRFISRRLRLLVLLPLVLAAIGLSPDPCRAQDESLEDAKILYKQAIQEKASGKSDEALVTYEKAIRMNRGVLGEDDDGLIGLLRTKYENKLKDSPENIEALEGMGFVSAVCYADMAKSIGCYEKVLELTTDEKVKTKTANLIERLKAMQEATQQTSDEITAQMRDERLKGWSEMERQERLAAQHEESQNRATKYAQLTQQRDQLDTRIPQLEEEINNLEEEYNKANRLWYTLKDDRYDRRRDRFEKDLDQKRKELSKARNDFDRATEEIDKMDREQPVEGSQTGAASGTAQPPGGEGSEPDSGPPPGDGMTGGTDPALPTGDNPDFPPQGGGETGPGGTGGDSQPPSDQGGSAPSESSSSSDGGEQPAGSSGM